MGLEFVGEENGTNLPDLIEFGAAAFFGLEIEQHREAGSREDVVPARDALFPTRALEKENHVAEAVVVVFRGIEEGGPDFRGAWHGAPNVAGGVW